MVALNTYGGESERRGRSQKKRKRRKKTNRQWERDVPWTMETMVAIRRCADAMVGGMMVYERSEICETAYTAQGTSVTFARRKREGRCIAIDRDIDPHLDVGDTHGGQEQGTLRAEGKIVRTENRWGSVITHSLSPAKVVHGSATKATRSVVPQRQHIDDTVAEEKRDGGGGGTMVVKFIVEKVGLDCRSAPSNGPIPSQEQILNGWLCISHPSVTFLADVIADTTTVQHDVCAA
ncbi:hypothetical protein B0H14DRAFT_2559270 [Mycena olivaceomarginata]|nr:hypothetical protein B0H14DRAFT_2559270 [Mycena olivaceomarginata]